MNSFVLAVKSPSQLMATRTESIAHMSVISQTDLEVNYDGNDTY